MIIVFSNYYYNTIFIIIIKSAAQKDKFYQLYNIHPSVPVNFAILELGKIVQMSLYFLGLLLTPKCDDGLLCDQTMTSINSYITLYGSLYNEV